MTIFDDRPRTRTGGSQEGDAAFAYLDESARPEAARIRALLNGMASRYPEPDRAALITRIRDEAAHTDATFELLVHEWCLLAGMRILAIEPAVPGTTRKPDFLVEANGSRFYLECVVARGESDLDAGSRRRIEDVLRAIDDIVSPDFLFALDVVGAPVRPVRLTALVGCVCQWLATLNHAEVAALPAEGRPVFEVEAEGMWLELRPMPREASRGDRLGRSTGILANEIRQVTPWEPMRKAVLRKAKHYGEPDLPLVVALGAMDRDARLNHAMEALYGTVAACYSPERGWSDAPQPDGVWRNSASPRYTRLSAVLVADRLNPWTLGQRSAVFIENLWANRPADFVDFQVDAWRKDGKRLQQREGRSFQELFGVPRDWPETPGAASDPC